MLNRRSIYTIFVVSIAFLSSCNTLTTQKEKKYDEKKPSVTTFEQKVSYMQGYTVVRNFKKNNIPLDETVFLAAMHDAVNGVTPQFPEDQWPDVKTEIEKIVKLAKENETKQAIETNSAKGYVFLEENKKKEGVHATETGLQYRVLKMGTGVKPTITDIVTLTYVGKFIDGTEFDSSIKKDTNSASFHVNRLIPGWMEALQLMPQGSKWEIYVPFELAYGDKKHRVVPQGSTLVFEIELLNVKPAVANPNVKSISPVKKK